MKQLAFVVLLLFSVNVFAGEKQLAEKPEKPLKEDRKPNGGPFVTSLGDLAEGAMVRIWDADMKIVCYALSGRYSSNGGGTSTSLQCFQK